MRAKCRRIRLRLRLFLCICKKEHHVSDTVHSEKLMRRGKYLQVQVEGMDLIADNCLFTFSNATLEYDFTCPAPPAQLQLVDHATELLTSEVNVVHCEPEVAFPAPQLLWKIV